MARITIEDCIAQVPNRFVLIRMTRLRAKQLQRGAQALVERGDNRDVVTALREIARGRVRLDESGEGVL
jgi:DNA-directed RNA polymerase subunit omega